MIPNAPPPCITQISITQGFKEDNILKLGLHNSFWQPKVALCKDWCGLKKETKYVAYYSNGYKTIFILGLQVVLI